MQRIPVSALAASAGALVAGGYFAVMVGAPAAVIAVVIATLVVLTTREHLGHDTARHAPQAARSAWVLALASAVVFLATVASWLYHVRHYDSLGSTTLLVHNTLGIVSLLIMVAFSTKAIRVRRRRTADLP